VGVITPSQQGVCNKRLLDLIDIIDFFFFVIVNQWTGKMSMDQGGVVEHTSWLPIPYWVLPEMNIELGFLQGKKISGKWHQK